jgi:peroxiredoxin
MVSNSDMILMFVSICNRLNAVCSVVMFIHAEEIKSYGVDEVYCLSVNDAFVMRQVCTRIIIHVPFCSEKCNDVCLCVCVQWGIHQGLATEDTDDSNPLNPGNFKQVKLLPDGACEFTRGMGMSCTWDTNRGFGERSWRYSVVINDMIVEQIFVEGGRVVQNNESDPFEVSDAATMVKYLVAHKTK